MLWIRSGFEGPSSKRKPHLGFSLFEIAMIIRNRGPRVVRFVAHLGRNATVGTNECNSSYLIVESRSHLTVERNLGIQTLEPFRVGSSNNKSSRQYDNAFRKSKLDKSISPLFGKIYNSQAREIQGNFSGILKLYEFFILGLGRTIRRMKHDFSDQQFREILIGNKSRGFQFTPIFS